MDDSDGATLLGAGGPSPEMLACIKAVVEEVLERCSSAPPARSGVVGPPSGPSESAGPVAGE